MSNKKYKKQTNPGPGTQSVWSADSEISAYGATQMPVFHSVTFNYHDLDTWRDVAMGKKEGHIYTRNSNPTVNVFEEKVRILEGAEAATSFSTGMAAISNTLFTMLSPGDRVVSIKDTYGGTSKILLDHLPHFGIDVQLCDTTNHEQIEKEIAKGCQALYLESPTNPTLKVMDLVRLSKAAKVAGATVIVDNTFASPINQNPLKLGVDLVIHSATKFLGGHSDALGGIVCGNKEMVKKIFHFKEVFGASLDPMSAYFLIRGIKTLELRINRQNSNAMQLAGFLQDHPKIEQVFYPGLETDPGHEIAKQQMSGYGGVFSFSLKGGYNNIKLLLENLKYAHLAASLGSVGTLIGTPKTTSHVETSFEEMKKLGIPENLIRCAVGIENIEDLINDFKSALEKVIL
ncbi:MAG: cystathionine gamma-synthase family protein [Bacteroidales bacterium]|nr:cystathionine gamma-synthase family protein [Bacteroidales bacterium]